LAVHASSREEEIMSVYTREEVNAKIADENLDRISPPIPVGS
jgi:hypothetical protein